MARRFNHSLHNLLTISRETARIGSVHKHLAVPEHLPFRHQFPLAPVTARGSYAARGIRYWVGHFLAAGIESSSYIDTHRFPRYS